uniref:C2H2-type domain-containing protein n=1 Tax=Oncorhynchus tshawytscha TaxID=74940 RepID=A0AAZ3RPF9_ONCTS
MKHSYRQALRNPSSSGRATCPFFSELHTFLAAMPDMPVSKETVKVSDEAMSSDQDEGPSVDVESEHLNEEMVSRKGKDEMPTREPTEERKRDESDSRINIGRKRAVEDVSDLELQGCRLDRSHKNGSRPAWSTTLREKKNEIPQPSSTATQEPTTSQVPTTTAQSSNKKTIPKACPVCQKTFKFEATMVRHIASHQKESLNKCPDILKCTFCEEIFSQGMDLKSHYSRTHQFTGPFPCPSCQKTFVSLTELRLHQRNESTPYQCSVCQRLFRTQYTLTIHERIHTGEKPFLCAECGKGFRSEKLLQSHSKSHVEGKPHSCSTCGKRFQRRELLKQHMLHHKDAAFICPDCGKKFFQLVWLRRHMLIHTGERPFLCDLCGKGFKSTAELRIHTRTHTGERPFKCQECGKGCRQKSELQEHLRRHTGERPYPCPVCDKRFYVSKDRKRHMLIHTGEKPFKCQVCGMAFNRRTLLRVHQQTKLCLYSHTSPLHYTPLHYTSLDFVEQLFYFLKVGVKMNASRSFQILDILRLRLWTALFGSKVRFSMGFNCKMASYLERWFNLWTFEA